MAFVTHTQRDDMRTLLLLSFLQLGLPISLKIAKASKSIPKLTTTEAQLQVLQEKLEQTNREYNPISTKYANIQFAANSAFTAYKSKCAEIKQYKADYNAKQFENRISNLDSAMKEIEEAIQYIQSKRNEISKAPEGTEENLNEQQKCVMSLLVDDLGNLEKQKCQIKNESLKYYTDHGLFLKDEYLAAKDQLELCNVNLEIIRRRYDHKCAEIGAIKEEMKILKMQLFKERKMGLDENLNILESEQKISTHQPQLSGGNSANPSKWQAFSAFLKLLKTNNISFPKYFESLKNNSKDLPDALQKDCTNELKHIKKDFSALNCTPRPNRNYQILPKNEGEKNLVADEPANKSQSVSSISRLPTIDKVPSIRPEELSLDFRLVTNSLEMMTLDFPERMTPNSLEQNNSNCSNGGGIGPKPSPEMTKPEGSKRKACEIISSNVQTGEIILNNAKTDEFISTDSQTSKNITTDLQINEMFPTNEDISTDFHTGELIPIDLQAGEFIPIDKHPSKLFPSKSITTKTTKTHSSKEPQKDETKNTIHYIIIGSVIAVFVIAAGFYAAGRYLRRILFFPQ